MHDIDEVRAMEVSHDINPTPNPNPNPKPVMKAAERKKNDDAKAETPQGGPSHPDVEPLPNKPNEPTGIEMQEQPVGGGYFSCEGSDRRAGAGIEKPNEPVEVTVEAKEEEKEEEEVDVPLQNPCTDVVMIQLSVAYFLFGTSVTMVELLMPLTLIGDADYGMTVQSDTYATQQKVAQTVGLIGIPRGVTNVLMMTVGYLLLTNQFGFSDRFCIAAGGISPSTSS